MSQVIFLSDGKYFLKTQYHEHIFTQLECQIKEDLF